MADPIWIAGMPRSGTSWLAQMFGAHPDVLLKYDPLFSYAFSGAVDASSSPGDWDRLFDQVRTTPDPYMDQQRPKEEGLAPIFETQLDAPHLLVLKTNRRHHLLASAIERGVAMRLLLLVRDPIETIGSWLANPTEFPADADPATEWRSGACRKASEDDYWGFEDWKRVTSLQVDLAERYPDVARLVTYADLDADPTAALAGCFDWAGLPAHPQVDAFLDASRTSHSDHPRSVYRNPQQRRSGHGRLPAGAADAIRRELSGGPLARFLTIVDRSEAPA